MKQSASRARSIAALVVVSLFVCAIPALAEQAVSPEASFSPPAGCVPDVAIAIAAHATQACIERFSATHEFIVTLHESRVRSADPQAEATPDIARAATEDAIERLRAANVATDGQTLISFETLPMPQDALLFPAGADHCVNVASVMTDRRVPGYGKDEFRIWMTALVCGRADAADHSIQIVQIKASERFRVASDQFRDRFRQLIPFQRFDGALRTLKLHPAP